MNAIGPNTARDSIPPLARVYRVALVVILILFVILSIIYNVTTPLFEGPDEAAHFLYVKYIADGNGLPALGHSPRDVLWEGLQQPPLYYAFGAILTRWIDTSDLPGLLWRNPHRGGETGGINLYYHTAAEAFPYRGASLAVRLVRALNILFGLVTVAMTFMAAREIFPRQPALALGAAAAVAFNPQFLATSALVNNDVATAASCSAGTWLALRAFRRNDLSWRDAIGLGLAVGLAAATKPSGLVLALPAGLAVTIVAWRRRSWGILLRGWLAVAMGVAVLSGWWYVRNVALYGDPLARNGFVAIEAEIVRPEPISFSEAFAYSAWMQKSFWGVFGNGVLMDFTVYRIMEILMQLAGLGLLVWLVRQVVRRMADVVLWLGLGFLVIWSVLVYLALLRFMQSIDATNQGRLLFPAVTALSILFVLGLSGFLPRRLDAVPAAVVSMGLLVLAIAAPFWYIVPAYAHPPTGQRLDVETSVSEGQDAHSARLPVRFGDGIELLNYTLTPVEIKPGSVIHLTLDWRCRAPMDASYKLFVHVLGYDGERLTQLDTIPYRGRFATVLWQPGQAFRDKYDLFITGKSKPSLARVQIGFFRWDDPGARLPVATAGGQLIGDHFDLTTFKITPKKIERPNLSKPAEVNFSEAISLIGYDLSTTLPRAGEPLTLTLYWQARVPDGNDYTVFIHLLDQDGTIVTQQDMPPQGGNYPTSIWAPEEFITDVHTLMLPSDLPAGAYTLAVGLYRPQDGYRLPVNVSGQPVLDGRAMIGAVEVD